jgi:hypothetical protein
MRITNAMITLRINNSPSYEIQVSAGVFPFLLELEYFDKNPNPITSQSVKMATINVGVFMLLNPSISHFGTAGSSMLYNGKKFNN